MTPPAARLVALLSGAFCNQQQAFDNPPLFAHITVTMRPLPQLAPGSLLLEQTYTITPAQPYRIRVLQVESLATGLIVHNHALYQEERFWGASADPGRLSTIAPADLRPLPGCNYVIHPQGEGFTGEVEPGCRCLVERKGATAYLVSRFEIEANRMRTIDRGHDPTTHEHLWGSLAGPFEFRRNHDYSPEIPSHWEAFWSSGAAAAT